ncbi:unnamed protein product [Cuscuta campestris]|uniref:Uncharacterized protein n=1 Tax=Cuscuta campestris TaxID=132261 RepID=A0A484KB55_9ASTE|nr:unnamed protein product [Cuscuta campestris]
MDLVTRVLLGESVLRLGMMVGLSFEDLKAQRFRVRFLALSLSLDDPPAGMPFSVKHTTKRIAMEATLEGICSEEMQGR